MKNALQILAQRYLAADAYNKPSIGFYLKKVHEASK